MKKKNNTLNFIVLFLVTIAVLYFSLKDNAFVILKGIINLRLGGLLLAIFLVFGYILFRSIAFRRFVQRFNNEYTIKESLYLNTKTLFYNAITPFATGGQPFQVYELKKSGVKIANGTNIIIQNFIAYQVSVLFLAFIAVIGNQIFGIFDQVGILKKLVAIGFIINTLITVVLFVLVFTKKANTKIVNGIIKFLSKLKIVKDKEKTTAKWNDNIQDLYNGGIIILSDKKSFFKCILENLVAHLCEFLVPLALLYGMGDFTSFNAITCIIASSYVSIIGSFVPIPGGSGGMEYGFIAFFGAFINNYEIHSIMLLWRFLTYYLGMIVGFILISVDKENKYEKNSDS